MYPAAAGENFGVAQKLAANSITFSLVPPEVDPSSTTDYPRYELAVRFPMARRLTPRTTARTLLDDVSYDGQTKVALKLSEQVEGFSLVTINSNRTISMLFSGAAYTTADVRFR